MRPSLRRLRQETERAWTRWQEHESTDVRREVQESWDRSSEQVSVEITAAPSAEAAQVTEEWKNSDLRTSVKKFESDLKKIALDGGFVVAITNPESTILWTTGSIHMQDRAAKANFAPGGKWDEASVGTNALDLSLRTGKPQVVFSAEHFAPLVHQWVCYSAPITDPRNGRQLGVLDLSTTWDKAHPLALSTTVALTNLIQNELSKIDLVKSLDHLELHLLGGSGAQLGGTPLFLTKRQLEICALLAMNPQGLSLETLHAHLYGDSDVSPNTLKAEVSHLRQVLGGQISSRPYRFELPVFCDAMAVTGALQTGNFSLALKNYRGELLPTSDGPQISELRNWIEVALHVAALHSQDVDAVSNFLGSHPYDLAVAEHLERIVAESDPRYPGIVAQVARAKSPG